MRADSKTFFELAEKERVAVKRGKKYVNLIVSSDPAKTYVDEDWVAQFMAIPAEFRVNPFEVSPSGDLFWADKRNVEETKAQIERSRQQHRDGDTIVCRTAKEAIKFLESL